MISDEFINILGENELKTLLHLIDQKRQIIINRIFDFEQLKIEVISQNYFVNLPKELQIEIKSNYKYQLLTRDWQDKRKEILFRDGVCQKCNSENNLQVHHKEYLSGHLAWEYENDFLITLCDTCHEGIHENCKLKQ